MRPQLHDLARRKPCDLIEEEFKEPCVRPGEAEKGRPDVHGQTLIRIAHDQDQRRKPGAPDSQRRH
jgi:hypothetical protein